MKQKRLTSYLKLGILLFGICMVLNGCQKDDSISTELNEFPQLKIETLYNPDLTQNRNLSKKLSSFKRKNDLNFGNNVQAREIYIEEYDFTIDDEVVKKITYDDYESYTFSIFRSVDNGKVENLLLSEQPEGSYKATIISYDLTEQEKEDLKSGIIPGNLPDKTTVYPVESTSGGDPIRIDEDGNCYFIDQIWEDEGVIYWTEVQRDCPESIEDNDNGSGGGGETSSGTGGSGTDTSGTNGTYDTGNDTPPDGEDPFEGLYGGGTNDGSSNTNTNTDTNDNNDTEGINDDCLLDENGNCIGDITIPLVRDEEYVELVSDCNLLENLSNSLSYQTRMQELIAQITSNTEIAYYGQVQDGSMLYSDNWRFEGEIDSVGVEITPPPTPMDSYIHNHFNNGSGCLSVFSGSDIQVLAHMYVNGQINDLSEFVMVVVTPGQNVNSTDDDTLYAITISDTQQFASIANVLSVDPLLIDLYFDNSKTPINKNISNELNEERLARLFEDRDFGLSLYRGNRDNLNQWTRLKVKSNGDVKENDCN